ncbi:MAG TPA: hypothetical protein DEA08_11050, partial [Planctomycetes bacterium]|nr:hypothetical protein [Planctomycetota bacterium]
PAAAPRALPRPEPAAAPAPFALPALPELALAGVEVSGVALRVEDRRDGLVEELRLRAEVAPLQIGAASEPAGLSLQLETLACGSLELQGSLRVRPRELRGEVRLQGSALSSAPLARYLRPLGLEPTLAAGALQARASTRLALGPEALGAEAELTELRFEPSRGAAPLVVSGVRLRAPRLTPSEVSVEVVGVERVALEVARRRDGALDLPGLRVLPAPPASSSAAPPSEPSALVEAAESESEGQAPREPSPPAALPTLRLDELSLGRLELRVRDEVEGLDLPLTLRGQLRELSLDPRHRAASEAKPAGFDLWLELPEVVASTHLAGELELATTGAALEGTLGVEGITARALEPLLERAGVRLRFAEAGALGLRYAARVDLGEEVEVGAKLSELALRDAREEWAGLGLLELKGVRLGSSGVDLGQIEVKGPRLKARREADQRLIVAGIELGVAPVATRASVAPLASEGLALDRGRGGEGEGDAAPVTSARPAPASPAQEARGLLPRGLPRVRLGGVRISEVGLVFDDRARAEPQELTLSLRVEIDETVLAKRALDPPLALRVRGSLPEVLDRLALNATLRLSPEQAQLGAGLRLAKLRAGPMAELLPPGVRIEVEDGNLTARLGADVAPVAAGGVAARAVLRELSWRDGERELLRVETASVAARRIDGAAGRFEVDSLRLAGVRTKVELGEAGALRALGVSVTPPAQEPRSEGAPAEEEPSEEPATQEPASEEPARAERTPEEEARAKALVAREARRAAMRLRRSLPYLELGLLDLGLERVEVRRPRAAPVVVKGLRLRSRSPLVLPGADVASAPPLQLHLRGAVAPLVSQISVELDARPFALEPDVEVRWDLDGLQPRGVVQSLPELEGKLIGEADQLRLQGSLRASLRPRRREPFDFRFVQEGFGAQLGINELRVLAGEEVLAGWDGLEVVVDAIRPERLKPGLPRKGPAGLHVSLIELNTPRLRAWRDQSGLHALGFRIPPPPAPPQPAPEAESSPAAPAAEPEPPAPAKPAPQAPQPDPPLVVVERVVARGADVRIVDRSVDPPLFLPLTNLDLSVRGLTSAALYEHRQIQLALELEAGSIPLRGPEPNEAPAWQALRLESQVGLWPKPHGRVRATLRDFQLRNLSGAAGSKGTTIGEGTLDVLAQLRLTTEQDLDVKVLTELADLSVSEGDEGWLREQLKLPLPTNATIVVLRGGKPDFEIPLDPPVFNVEGLNAGKVAGIVSLELTRILSLHIVSVVKNAPLTLLKGLGGAASKIPGLGQGLDTLTGLGGAALNDVPLLGAGERADALRLEFPAAESAPGAGWEGQLAKLCESLDSDTRLRIRHELGRQDLARARQLARVSPRDRVALVQRLRSRESQLLVALERAALRARGHLLAERYQAAEAALAECGRRRRQLGRLQASLDEAYGLLEGNDDPQRRSRQALVAIGEARLRRVVAELERRFPELRERISVAPVGYDARPTHEHGTVHLEPLHDEE